MVNDYVVFYVQVPWVVIFGYPPKLIYSDVHCLRLIRSISILVSRCCHLFLKATHSTVRFHKALAGWDASIGAHTRIGTERVNRAYHQIWSHLLDHVVCVC